MTATTSSPSKPYSPSVGDVVEFDDIERERQKGIIFIDHENDLIVAFKGNWHQVKVCHNFVKVGSTDCIPNKTQTWKGPNLAKAYFSKQASPKFKVGDVVSFDWDGGSLVGIVAPDGDIAAHHTDGSEGSFGPSITSNIRPTGQNIAGLSTWSETLEALPSIAHFTPDPSQSYAERQKAWVEFHGLKVGSKVKVVRRAEDQEDGWILDWLSNLDLLVGTEVVIQQIMLATIKLDKAEQGYVPYFVLEPVS